MLRSSIKFPFHRNCNRIFFKSRSPGLILSIRRHLLNEMSRIFYSSGGVPGMTPNSSESILRTRRLITRARRLAIRKDKITGKEVCNFDSVF